MIKWIKKQELLGPQHSAEYHAALSVGSCLHDIIIPTKSAMGEDESNGSGPLTLNVLVACPIQSH